MTPAKKHPRFASIGTLLGSLSAAIYTASNICLRRLSELGCDPTWVIFNREFATVLVVGVWIAWQLRQGQRVLPGGTALHQVLIAAVLTQLVANLCSQWAMGTVGLAVTIPASAGTTITGGALLGWAVLRERVSLRVAIAIGLIWASLGFLGSGAEVATISTVAGTTASFSSIRIIGGVAAACIAGMIFAVLNVTTCDSVRKATSPATIGFLISLMGVICLGPICIYRLGAHAWINASVEALVLAATAGLLNFFAFVAQGYALQRTSLVYTNILSASQVALAAIAGTVLFREAPSPMLLLGVSLTLLGVIGAGFSRPSNAATN